MPDGNPAPAPPPAGSPVVPPRYVEVDRRLPGDLVAGLEHASSCDVSDVVGELYTMDPGIRPLYQPLRRVVGPALTVKAPPGDNLTILEALRIAGEGDVIVVDWRGHLSSAGSGSLVLRLAQSQGLAGVVIDGAWRDLGEVAAIGLPIFGRAVASVSPPKARLGDINVPVSCGGVVVDAGDVIVADADGVAVIPRRHAAAVAAHLQTKLNAPPPSLEKLASNAVGRGERYRQLFAQAGGVDEVRRVDSLDPN